MATERRANPDLRHRACGRRSQGAPSTSRMPAAVMRGSGFTLERAPPLGLAFCDDTATAAFGFVPRWNPQPDAAALRLAAFCSFSARSRAFLCRPLREGSLSLAARRRRDQRLSDEESEYRPDPCLLLLRFGRRERFDDALTRSLGRNRPSLVEELCVHQRRSAPSRATPITTAETMSTTCADDCRSLKLVAGSSEKFPGSPRGASAT